MMHVCELLGGFYFDDRVKGVIRNHLDCHQGSFRPYRTLYQSCRKESSQWSYCSSLLSFRKFSQSVIVLLATMLFRLRRIGKWRSCFKRKQLGKEWYYRAGGECFNDRFTSRKMLPRLEWHGGFAFTNQSFDAFHCVFQEYRLAVVSICNMSSVSESCMSSATAHC